MFMSYIFNLYDAFHDSHKWKLFNKNVHTFYEWWSCETMISHLLLAMSVCSTYQGRSQDLAGEGARIFFSDLEICMRFVRGVRGQFVIPPREIF